MTDIPRGKGSPYSLGYDAGAALTLMRLGRTDHATSLVEWYRGFCAATKQTPLLEVERLIQNRLDIPLVPSPELFAVEDSEATKGGS